MDQAGSNLLPKTRKARAILALLAMTSPRPVSRTRLTGLLWSQREREQARGSLRQCVHEIQGLLQGLGPGLFEADREQLRLSEAGIWLDVRQSNFADTGVLLEDLTGLDPAFDAWIEAEQSRQAASQPAILHRHVAARIGVRRLRAPGGGDDAVLAEGLSEEIAVAISRFRWMPVIAPDGLTRGSSEPELEYIVDGTVRRVGRQIRVALRLQDVRAGGEVAWARNFDGLAADLLCTQDVIAEQTAAQIDPELLLREGARAATHTGNQVTATSLSLAAVPAIFRLERESFERAGRMLEEAVRLAPESSSAHAWLAHWYVMGIGQGWEPQPATAMQRAESLAERAIMLDPLDARALTIAGHVRGFLNKQIDDALMLHNRALALNPALAWAWMMSGLAHSYRGDHEEAIRRIETARALSPFDPHGFFFDMALMLPHLMLGDYEQASKFGRLAAQIKPSFSSSWKGLLTAFGHLGRIDEAAEALARLEALEPGFGVRAAVERSPLRRPEDRARYAEGMRLAGLRD